MATLDATGLDCYLVTTVTVATTKAECTTAIGAGKRIGQIKTLGDIGGTRAITEHKFLSADDTLKSVGSVSYGNISLDMPFNASDTTGQDALRDMFDGKTRMKLIIKETDGNFTVIPSVICSDAKKSYTVDDLVMFKAVIEQDAKEVNVIA